MQFDHAITLVGNGISNAMQETIKVGDKENTKYEPKYSLADLLRPDYRLPRPPTEAEKKKQAVEAWKRLVGKGATLWKIPLPKQ